jgi:predicted RNA-binding Zn ribbon-like protein
MERPLTGEPLAVDLVNTRWHSAGGDRDLFATAEGFDEWLRQHDFTAPADEKARRVLLSTRDTLQRAFTGEVGAEDEVNAILARAFIVRSIHDGRVREQPMFAQEEWRTAWLIADDYARLRQAGEQSIRQCDGTSCILYFYDPSLRRRWCSMARCGNRAKARRHYTRRNGSGESSVDAEGMSGVTAQDQIASEDRGRQRHDGLSFRET